MYPIFNTKKSLLRDYVYVILCTCIVTHRLKQSPLIISSHCYCHAIDRVFKWYNYSPPDATLGSIFIQWYSEGVSNELARFIKGFFQATESLANWRCFFIDCAFKWCHYLASAATLGGILW